MDKRQHHKIIFTGPVGSGKTTAIVSLSDIEPVVTNELASDMTKLRKPETTVAMDYGLIKLKGASPVHIYATPGQERFKFMWDILTKGGIGLVLLLNNMQKNPLNDMRFFLTSFQEFIDDTGVVIGVTHMDKSPEPSLDEYHRNLPQKYSNIPLFSVDARSRQDLIVLVESLLFLLD